MKKVFLLEKLILAGSFSLGLFFFVAAPLAFAQTTSNPQFFVTWKASNSYIPSSYIGKALPGYGSRITASVDLLSQGHLLNLQNQTIYWYLNDTLIGGGAGVQSITFPPFGLPPNSLTLKVELPNYAGGYLTHSIDIPYVNPQVVIGAAFPNGQFSTNPLVVEALPYFFNTSSTSNLSYTWAVNGQTGGSAENPQIAQITLPAGTPAGTGINISVTVENPVGSTVATANESLTYENQL
jgi:hypothetical protein